MTSCLRTVFRDSANVKHKVLISCDETFEEELLDIAVFDTLFENEFETLA